MTVDYDGPMSISQAFATEVHLREIMESLVDDLLEQIEMGRGNPDFIPPVIYSEMGKCFNVHYNFLINTLAITFKDERVNSDFLILAERRQEDTKKLGVFLVCGILEDYYNIARINPKKIDMSKYKNAKSLDIFRNFYNTVVYKKGEQYVKFNAVPINEMALAKLIDRDQFNRLQDAAKRPDIEQAAFGDYQHMNLLKAIGRQSIEYYS